MKRTSFILPFIATLFWWVAAQQPYYRTAGPEETALQAIPAPDTLLPGKEISHSGIAGFLAGGFRQALRLQEADSLLLLSVREDGKGGRHARIQQLHHGIPVFGAWYRVQEKNGAIISGNGMVFPKLSVNPEPALSEAEALEMAKAALPASLYAWQDEHFEAALRRQKRDAGATFYPEGKLIIVPEDLSSVLNAGEEQAAGDKGFRLAWRFDIFAVEPELKREHIFIDAIDGKTLHRLPQMAFCHAPAQGKAAYRPGLVDIATDSCNGSATPKYRLRDVLRNIEIFNSRNSNGTPPISFYNETTLWVPPQADTVAVAAMYGLETWYDYLLDNFGWRGLDGRGEYPIEAWVHYRNNFDNAVYSGFLLLGDGNPNGGRRTPLVSRDVVAHEASHGLIENTAALLYVYEPGVINEAIADIFACLVELEQGDGNWVLGEDLVLGGERRLDAPHLMGLPDTYLGDFWIQQAAPDQALHENSTVLGHWFYLLAEGGAGVNDLGTPYSVTAMGRDRAAELLFHTLLYFLNPNDGFFGMRRASMLAASPAGLNWNGDEVENLATAWCAIGVGGCEAMGNESVTLLSPNGDRDAEYVPGAPVRVEWENTSGVSNMKVFFSANDGASWQELVSFPVFGTTGYRDVIAPNVNSRLCRIRVAALDDPLAFDDSDSTFSIIGCSLLSGFTVWPESGCYGTSFTVDNSSRNQGAGFSWLVDGRPYPAPPGGFTLLAPEPGRHTITLVAQDSVCIDTFSRVIQVAPQPSAAFNLSVSNRLVTAAATFPDGEQYFWSVNGQALPLFNGSPSFSWTAPDTGAFELCLFVGDNCSVGGEEVCQIVSVSASENCVGTSDIWKQYNNKSNINDMAEYGNTLIISTTGGLVFFDKISGQILKTLNTVSIPAMPCQETGSIAVDSVNGWVYVALKTTRLGANGFVRIDLATDSITHFTTWNLAELLSNDITVLKVDEQGRLWVGTNDKGIWVGVPGISFEAIYLTAQGLPDNDIVDIGFAAGATTWVAMRNHLAKIENGGVATVFSSLNSPLPGGPSPGLNTMLVDGNTVWVGAVNGLHRLEGTNWQSFDASSYDVESNYIVDIVKGSNGKIYFGLSLNSYIIEYDGNVFNNISCLAAPTGGAGRIKRFVMEGGNLWIGCEYGLFSWNEMNACQNHNLSDFPILRNVIDNILLKADGGKLIVQDESVVKINGNIASPIDIAAYLPYGPGYLPYLNLNEMVEDENGIIWVALDFYDYSLAKISPITGAWDFVKHGYLPGDLPFESNILNLAFQAHKLYASTTSDGIWIMNTQNNRWEQHFDGNNSPVWDSGARLMEIDPQGNLWLATSGYLPGINTSHLLKFDGLQWDTVIVSAASVGAFTFTSNGVLWAVTGHSNPPNFYYRIQKYVDAGWVVLNDISSLINNESSLPGSLKSDQFGNLLIGTNNAGTYKIDTNGVVIEHYTTCNSGLISNNVREIEIDSLNGAIWFATDNGVAAFTPSSQTIQPSFHPSANICFGSNASFVNTTLGAVSFEWRSNGELVSIEQSPTLSFSSEGEYIIELTAFNESGCATSTSRVVTVHPVADLSDFPQNIIECDASWLLCAPEGMAEYEWKRGTVISNEQCLRVEQRDNGVYELKITDYCGNVRNTAVAVTLSGACVYPGDLNNDGVVDYRDLLWLGQTFGYFGPARMEKGINWREYPALDWTGYLPGGANFKYCDADGSGFIDLSDLEAIIINYLNTHGGYPGLPGPEQSPYSFVPVLVGIDTTLGNNTYKLNIDIVARNANGLGIDNFYGAGMRMYYTLPPGVQLVGSPEFSFDNSSLRIDSVNAIGLVKLINDEGYMDVAVSKVDHQNQSGVNVLGNATFIITDDHLPIFDSLEFTLNLVGSTAITNEGNFIPVNGMERTFTFGPITGTDELFDEGEILIYPNPTTGRCRLSLPHSPAREVAIRVFNARGTEVWAAAGTGQALFYEMDLSALPAGIYWAVVATERGRFVQRIVKV